MTHHDNEKALLKSYDEDERESDGQKKHKHHKRIGIKTKDDILVEISKIKHSIELGCSTIEATYRVGMIDGMYYAIDDDKTDIHEDSIVNVNTKYDFRMKTDNEIKKCMDGVISEINSQAIKPWPVDLDTTYDEGIKYGLQVAFGEVDYDASESTMINFKKGVLAGLRSAVQYKNLNSTKTQESIAKVNIKYELDKEAYRQYVADMNQIESEFKANNRSRKFIAGEELEEGDLVYKHPDGKMYKSDCIPANLNDVCEWWIQKYKRNSTFDEYTIMSNITENMEYLIKRRGL